MGSREAASTNGSFVTAPRRSTRKLAARGSWVFNRSSSLANRRRSSQPWWARRWSELKETGGGAKRPDRRQSRAGAVRTTVVFRAVLAPFVASSGPDMDGRSSCCVEGLSSVGGVAGTAWFGGEQWQVRVCRFMEREEKMDFWEEQENKSQNLDNFVFSWDLKSHVKRF